MRFESNLSIGLPLLKGIDDLRSFLYVQIGWAMIIGYLSVEVRGHICISIHYSNIYDRRASTKYKPGNVNMIWIDYYYSFI